MTRKQRLFVFSGLILAVVILTMSCSKDDKTSKMENGEKEIINLTYWYSWTGVIKENNENLARDFNATIGKEKGIVITPEYQGTYDDLHQKLEAGFIAGDTPEISVMEIASINRFAQNRVIIPLDEYVDNYGVNVDNFNKGLMENSYSDDGTLFGIPYLRSTPLLYVNSDLMEKFGLDPMGPKNWQEFAEFAKTIYEKSNGEVLGITLGPSIWYSEAYMFERGLSVLSNDELTSNVADPKHIEFNEFIVDLKDKGYIKLVASNKDSSAAQEADFTGQKSAMRITSTGGMGNVLNMADEQGFNVNTTFLPKWESYGVPTGGCNLVISSQCSEAQKEAAYEFLNYITQDDQIAASTALTGYMPITYTALEHPVIQTLFTERPQFKTAVDQLKFGHGRPSNPYYGESVKKYITALERIWLSGENAEQELAKAAKEMNVILNQ